MHPAAKPEQVECPSTPQAVEKPVDQPLESSTKRAKPVKRKFAAGLFSLARRRVHRGRWYLIKLLTDHCIWPVGGRTTTLLTWRTCQAILADER
uniref:Uncharacterized protein n=1 Tax=Steinernema glaseri TaxID=37863 RepID=A0A1I7Y9Z6_9BILA